MNVATHLVVSILGCHHSHRRMYTYSYNNTMKISTCASLHTYHVLELFIINHPVLSIQPPSTNTSVPPPSANSGPHPTLPLPHCLVGTCPRPWLVVNVGEWWVRNGKWMWPGDTPWFRWSITSKAINGDPPWVALCEVMIWLLEKGGALPGLCSCFLQSFDFLRIYDGDRWLVWWLTCSRSKDYLNHLIHSGESPREMRHRYIRYCRLPLLQDGQNKVNDHLGVSQNRKPH